MNSKLVEKYNKPVPRYTSYPPANFFRDTYTFEQYQEDVGLSNGWKPETISLYFHIPFCQKLCFYCGCNSCPMADAQTVIHYVEAIKSEIRMVSERIDLTRPVTQVHFGGGTPNAIPVDFLSQIMELLYTTFTFRSDAEIAIECNPAYLDKTYIDQLRETGFNRFSLGIQDFNTQVLKGVNRDPSMIPVNELMNMLREGRQRIAVNLDFIYGLPYQTVESFEDTIRKAIACDPDRLVTFSYAHVPWVNKNQKILEKKGLPDQDTKTAMFEHASGMLVQHGYHPIGLDHFVKEKDELFQALESGTLHRNFQGYCTRNTTGQVYAFGVSGISQLHRVYAQNTKSVDEYLTDISKDRLPIRKGYRLTDREIMVREVITELMCNRQIEWNSVAAYLHTNASVVKETIQYNEQVLKQFEQDGIIHFNDDSLSITEEGILFIRNVAASFDPLLGEGNQKFSKPV